MKKCFILGTVFLWRCYSLSAIIATDCGKIRNCAKSERIEIFRSFAK